MQNTPILTAEQADILEELKSMDAADTIAGCYNDIPNVVYHHPECPGYSSTTLKRIIAQSYNHWFEKQEERDDSLVFGSAFHVYNNEPHNFDQEFIIAPTSEKRSAEWKAVAAMAGGRAVLSREDFETVKVMSVKLMEHPIARDLLNGSQRELTFFSRDQETGLLKKIKVDAYKPMLPSDLKSTMNASPQAFARDSRKFLTRVSAAFYCEVLTDHFQKIHRDFYLIACEKVEPREIAVYRVDDDSIDRGVEDVRRALRIIRRVLDGGIASWKGYDLSVTNISI